MIQLLTNPLWPLLKPFLHVTRDRQRVRVEFLRLSEDLRASALKIMASCVSCRRDIHPIRVRTLSVRSRIAGLSAETRAFYSGTCPQEVSRGCSRSKEAKAHMHELFSQFAQPEGEKTFIFSPGGADHGNVYSTWPALMSAVQATAGPKQIDGPESGSFVAAKLIKDVAELEAQGRGREEAERTTRLVACVFADYFGRGDTDFNQDAFFEECGLSGEFIARMSKARKKHGRGNNPKNWIDE